MMDKSSTYLIVEMTLTIVAKFCTLKILIIFKHVPSLGVFSQVLSE